MGSPYAGVDQWVDDIVVPDDGDNRDGASVSEGEEGLADRTTYLKALLNGGDINPANITTEFLTVTGGSVSSVIPGLIVNELAIVKGLIYSPALTETYVVNLGSAFFDATEWKRTNTGRHETLVTTVAPIQIELDLDNGVVITAYTVTYKGHGAGLPATMPVASIKTIDSNGVLSAAIAGTSKTDTATLVEYPVDHLNIALTGLSVTVDRTTKRYILEIQSEGGVGSASGNQVSAVKVVYTRSKPN